MNGEYIQSQYSNSPTIKALLQGFADNIDPTADLETFLNNIFDPETANGMGLDIWGQIVALGSRQITTDGTVSLDPLLVFRGGNDETFNNGIFYDPDNVSSSGNVVGTLDDDYFRVMIFAKAVINIGTCDMQTLNKIASSIFSDRGILASVVVVQGTLPNGDYYNTSPMLVRFIFRSNNITNLEKTIFNKLSDMILSAGVQYDYKVITKDPLFGFAGSGLNPFNQGAFGRALT